MARPIAAVVLPLPSPVYTCTSPFSTSPPRSPKRREHAFFPDTITTSGPRKVYQKRVRERDGGYARRIICGARSMLGEPRPMPGARARRPARTSGERFEGRYVARKTDRDEPQAAQE